MYVCMQCRYCVCIMSVCAHMLVEPAEFIPGIPSQLHLLLKILVFREYTCVDNLTYYLLHGLILCHSW